MSQKESSFAEKITPVLVVIVVGLAFITGSLWQKVNSLTGGGSASAGNNLAAEQPVAPEEAYTQLDEDKAEEFTQVSSFTLSSENASEGSDHVRGNRDAEVFLVEYSDLECPFCAQFHDTAKQLMTEYDGQVGWIYRHFPLDAIHPNARPAALGSECVASLAGEDAFWSFIDEVFANQQTVMTKLADVAVELGVDRGAYETCVSSATFADAVDDDYQKGLDVGVSGTPGNFVMNKDGEVWAVHGAVPYANLKEAVEEALN